MKKIEFNNGSVIECIKLSNSIRGKVREYINWECKDCGWQWVGDYSDTWCPYCDENNIFSPTHIIED